MGLALALALASCEPQERRITPDMLHFPQSASGTDADADFPVITFDSMVVHFDTLAIGERFLHTFRFTNTGKSPLVIDQVRPSCGCTTLKDWPRDPIEPGGGGTLSVEFNSTGFPGPAEKTILVSTNAIPRDHYLKLIGYVSGMEVKREQELPVKMERTR